MDVKAIDGVKSFPSIIVNDENAAIITNIGNLYKYIYVMISTFFFQNK